MKIVFFLFFLFRGFWVLAQTDLEPLPLHTITPSADRNYTIRYRPHFGVTFVNHRLGLSGSEATISYFDGLGRCVQVVESGANPGRQDLITPVSPDFYGREEVKSYLPYAGGTDKGIYNTGAQSAQNNYYGGLYGSSGGNAYAYSERRYEESGAGRLLESSRPGAPYRLSGGHTVRYNYSLNSGNEVRRYVYANGSVSSSGYFAAGTLYRQEISGEDNRRRIVFTNFRGDAVLERCYASSGEALDTYYVYDVLDRLVCVIPPMLGGSAVISSASLSAYCYRYNYDKRGNITERMLPGVVTEKIGYNAAGLPVSRDQGDRHFMLSYDNHNRLLQESYRYGSGSSIVLAERRYDSYPPVNGLGFVAATGYASAYDSRVVGLQTYEKERILAGNRVSEPGLSGRYIERCFYYDSKGRLIQRVEQNHLGGVSRYHYAYDFVGNVTSECETHTVGGVTTNLEKVNNYDHVSRLLGCKVYLNGVYKGKVDYEYDALGRLSVRRYGENAVTETLSYDIRGRLTEQGSSFFRLGLRYENAQKGPGLYGGDISEWSCRYGSKAEQLYTFSYDGAGRFTGGNHYENGVLVNKYVEQGIGYDKNGNILSLKRYSNGVLVDNLAYSYNGNSLSGLTESAVVASGDIYERKNVSGGSYDYDIYGNLSKDSRKNLNFEYNILNLLHNVREGSIIMAGYEYSYGGVKLKVWGSDGNGYAYVGNLVYRVTGSSFVFESGLFGEGVVSSNGICYHLKDHLGSIRAIVDGSGRLLEENDYYAFGHRHPRSEHAQSSANRFKYNGKELQTVGGLGYLDYGARMYDQSLGRWFTTDPLSEKYYGLSPYVYCGNNPLRYVDPDGRDVWEVNNEGRIINRIKDKTQDAFYMVVKDADGNYQRTFTTDAEGNKNYNSINFEYGTVESQRSISFSPDGKTTDTYDVYRIRGDGNGTKLFEFMSNNVSGSGTGVEISQAMTGVAEDKGLNFITTGHMKATEPGMTYLLRGQLLHGYTIRELNHSHPYTPKPSKSDNGFASQITNIMKQRNVPAPTFNLYYVPGKQKIPFGK